MFVEYKISFNLPTIKKEKKHNIVEVNVMTY